MSNPLKSDFWPKTFNEWRVVPRIILMLYGYMMYESYAWFTSLDNPTTQQVSFVSTVWGLFAAVSGFYLNTRPDNTREDGE